MPKKSSVSIDHTMAPPKFMLLANSHCDRKKKPNINKKQKRCRHGIRVMRIIITYITKFFLIRTNLFPDALNVIVTYPLISMVGIRSSVIMIANNWPVWMGHQCFANLNFSEKNKTQTNKKNYWNYWRGIVCYYFDLVITHVSSLLNVGSSLSRASCGSIQSMVTATCRGERPTIGCQAQIDFISWCSIFNPVMNWEILNTENYI